MPCLISATGKISQLGILCNESSPFSFFYKGTHTNPLTGKGLYADIIWEISFTDKNECLSTRLQDFMEFHDRLCIDILPAIQPVGDPGQQQGNA